MRARLSRPLRFLAFCLLAPALLVAQSAHRLQREGDSHYERSNFKEAEQAYRQASEKKAGDPTISYNTGNAVYQQGNYAESEKWFDQAAQGSKEPARQADALHNLGNARLKQQKYREAAEAYEKSLRLRPGDPATKANLQLAKKKWQQQQQQEQQQQSQQQNQQPQQNQNQPQQPQQNPNPQQNQNQSQQQPNPAQQPNSPSPQQQEQPSDGQMSRDNARRLLETAVGPEDQKNARKYREMEPGKHQTRPKKDW